MSKRKITIILTIIISIVLLMIIGVGGVKVVNANKINNSLEIGIKYLTEGNYEEAIITFEKVINIDNKNINAYIALADAYIADENYEKAIDIYLKAESNVKQNDKKTIIELFNKLVDSIEITDINVECKKDEKIKLPSSIEISVKKKKFKLDVEWEKDKVDTSKTGIVKIKGTISKINKEVNYIVNIIEETIIQNDEKVEEIKETENKVDTSNTNNTSQPISNEAEKTQSTTKREIVFTYKNNIKVDKSDYLPNASDIGLVAIDSNGNDCSNTFGITKGFSVSDVNSGEGSIQFIVIIDGQTYQGKTTFTLNKREPVFTYLSNVTVDREDQYPTKEDIQLVAIDSNGNDCSNTYWEGKGFAICCVTTGVGFQDFFVEMDGKTYSGRVTFTLKQ
ncbi:lipopolysaccharide assembly protein LapB [Paraclostridium bifermentans]|uniref:tetratricopeptide repeat protein n=1 Tax=Paraclostridium bifermentans TaxID=1490 RepID=UPI0018A0CFC9|nr:tetratricopeptide repeat protein [Paraclostridium bifermentans]